MPEELYSGADSCEAILTNRHQTGNDNAQSIYEEIAAFPYSIRSRLELAERFAQLGYPDLAAGEAYLALLLIDEVVDDSGEYHDEALCHLAKEAGLDLEAGENEEEQEPGPSSQKLAEALGPLERETYMRLAQSLADCDNFKSAIEFCKRGLVKQPYSVELLAVQSAINDRVKRLHLAGQPGDWPDRGFVRRELYPWNDHEPNRYSSEAINFVNEQLSKVAPKLEVRITELDDLSNGTDSNPSKIKQLGVFAKEDLAPGELILDELSVLTATSRSGDEFCDACGIRLHSSSSEQAKSCPDCDEAIFCSERCLAASASYHPALCGRDLSGIAQDSAAKDASDDLYTQLVLRAIAMSITRNTHPLDLPETKYTWGDYSLPAPSSSSPPRTLPFSFRSTILLPLHILQHLDINPFLADTTTSTSSASASPPYATWVLNTLHAKLRATASARQDRASGRPEAAALHPLWCLANHSCDPNVRWEWRGAMRFWVRTPDERVAWAGRARERWTGIRRGDEIRSHYCDVGLPVGERREWAVGALGGVCRCERCVWEEKQVG